MIVSLYSWIGVLNKEKKHMKLKRFLILVFALPFLLAFRSTDFKGYTDPDFMTYKADSFVVCYTNATANFQMPFEKQFFNLVRKNKLGGKRCDDVFPPTRKWTNESRLELMVKLDIDALLVVTVGLEEGDRFFSQEEYTAELIDAGSSRVVWLGKAAINASGTAFTSIKGSAKTLAKAVFKDLANKGHTK
tara:strand:+ start:99 stop:668 length:570 start_codon:yes stop_codon:yes gene_type:complete